MFGYVLKRNEDDYIVNLDLFNLYAGYNVVPKTVDPYNIYNIEDVRAYCEANPNMVLSEHPLEYKKNLLMEMRTLKQYLAETDYMAIKCAEKGISMASAYPEEYVKRQQARDRINEIRALIGESNG